MKSIVYFLFLIGAFVVSGCYNNNHHNNMMGGSRNRNYDRNNNNRSMSLVTIVYCNAINKDCINNISTGTTPTQQEIEILKCSTSFNSCMVMSGAATMATMTPRRW